MGSQILGDYTLLKKLGEGGFGSVYLAEHRFIKKRFALKILHESVLNIPNFIERFEEDVGILATLDHPSIIKIHNISKADNRYFLVMDVVCDELGEVMNLDHFLATRNKILSERELETILRQLASAVDYAHSIPFHNEYLVHRGIKLSNILVDTKGQMRVFLSDFGLSRLLGEGKVLQSLYERMLHPSQENLFFNHYSFLSPEQKALNTNEKITAKSDVYAFGVLAYYLIARKFPEGYFEMPSKMAPEYNLNWDLFICKCLQRDPKKRPDFLLDALNGSLSTSAMDVTSLSVLSWEEVEKKVENAMQMSFEFSSDWETHSQKMAPASEPEVESPHQLKPIIRPQELERPQYEPDPGTVFHKDLNVSFYKPKKVEVKEIEPLLTEMVIIPGGSFFRGSNNGARDEMPRHKVTLSSFALDIHPVINEQFLRFLDAMGGEKDSNNNDIIRLRDSRIKKSGGKLSIESGYGKHPVVGVTWYGALAYAKWVGKRLPTEAEREIAAAGGLDNNIYPSGTDMDHTQANFFSSDTTAVMSYPANGYGLYDLSGNVYEWCHDWYAYNYYEISIQEPENPQGPLQGVYRVLRGGCWKSLKEDLRCSHRHRNNPGAVNGTYGFRCAADVS
jgi:formylglycine-generating enzyme required for sulfatase activity